LRAPHFYPTPAAYEHLLIVSIDALHPKALDAEVSPTLHGLMLEGRYTLEGRSVPASAARAVELPILRPRFSRPCG